MLYEIDNLFNIIYGIILLWLPALYALPYANWMSTIMSKVTRRNSDKDRGASFSPSSLPALVTFDGRPCTCSTLYHLLRVEVTVFRPNDHYGQDEERLVQRTHGPVTGQEFFNGSGTGSAQGTVQVPRYISLENVSQMSILII